VRHLLIELSDNAVRFAESSENSIRKFDFIFRDKKDYRYKEQLDEFLIESGLKNVDFEEVSISWSGFRTTLVPSNIFSESNPESIFQLCFGKEISASTIDYNRIPEHGIVNVFDIPLWVKSFFVVRYPRSVIQHEGSHLVRGMLNESSFKLKSILIIYDDYFLLGIVKENKLHFYSLFNFLEIDDIVYHFMFTLQQKELTKEKGNIQLIPGVGSSMEKMNEIEKKLSSFQGFEKGSITINSDFISNTQKQCV